MKKTTLFDKAHVTFSSNIVFVIDLMIITLRTGPISSISEIILEIFCLF